MSEADTILRDCRRFGFHLRRDGDRIAIEPPRRCPAEVLAMLRAHKQEALDLLDTAALILTPDCAFRSPLSPVKFSAIDSTARTTPPPGVAPSCGSATATPRIRLNKTTHYRRPQLHG